MLVEIPYNRKAAVEYAEKWAFKRNPEFFNFDGMGGDCTNFASQCLFAGAKAMNYTPVLGWYFISSNDRSASWSGVQYLYNFLISNLKTGPYAIETDLDHIEAGDLVQLGNAENHFYHTPVVVKVENGELFVAAHTFDAFMRPLNSYFYNQIRFIHIVGARKYL
jgi:hypothetical protein